MRQPSVAEQPADDGPSHLNSHSSPLLRLCFDALFYLPRACAVALARLHFRELFAKLFDLFDKLRNAVGHSLSRHFESRDALSERDASCATRPARH
jgi:hypothetical protein